MGGTNLRLVPSKLVWLVLLLLVLPFFPLAVLPLPHPQLTHYAEKTTIVWPANTTDKNSSAELSVLFPAQAPDQYLFASAGSGSNYYWVGATDSNSADLSNSGVQATIQVISTSVSGCLSFWVADDAASNIWARLGTTSATARRRSDSTKSGT